jgi:hypothetical protein
VNERTQRVLINCRAKALGAPAPDLIAVRDPGFHAELLAESAVRLVRFRLAQAQQRAMSQVILPKLTVQPTKGKRRRKRR